MKLIIQLEKAQRSAGLVRETRHVTRNGQSFNMAVWVRPGASRQRGPEPAADDGRQVKLGLEQPQGAFLAPNGKPSNLSPAQWYQCRTRAFKEWFGDWENDPENASKIVDANGEPRVLYHGSKRYGFESFDHYYDNYSQGFFFSETYDVANGYVPSDDEIDDMNARREESAPEYVGGVYECFLNIRKPYVDDFEGRMFNADARGLSSDRIVELSREAGYDGTVLKNIVDNGGFKALERATNIFIAFEPEQIKSATGNNGAFDPKTPVISKSLTFSGWKLQGRMKFQGMQISIENKKGSYRSGVSKDGHKWRNFMHYAYGYIRGTVGPDGDHVDCYIGPDKKSARVFIVHQNDPKTGSYDEDKVMLGFSSPEEAKKAYLGQYDSPKFFGSMEEADIETFKDKVFMKKNHGKKLVIRKG